MNYWIENYGEIFYIYILHITISEEKSSCEHYKIISYDVVHNEIAYYF